MNGTRSRVYESLLESCGPLEWGEPWSFVPNADVRRGVSDPDAVLDELLSTFGEAAVVESGVAERQESGSLELAARLGGHSEILVSVRDWTSSRVVNLLTAAGGLAPNSLPMLSALDDESGTHAATDERRLYAAFDVRDVALLRGLGLRATLAPRFEDLDGDHLDSFCRRFRPVVVGGETSGETPLLRIAGQLRRESAGHPTRLRLTFVAWSPESQSREPRPETERVIAFLSRAARHLRHDLSTIDVWCPGEEQLDRLAFLIDLRRTADVCRALVESADECSQSLPESRYACKPGAPAKPVRAIPDLSAILADTSTEAGREERARGWREFAESVGAQVEPLFEEAQLEKTIEKRETKLQLAEHIGLSRMLCPSAIEAVYREALGHSAGTARARVREYLAVADRTLDLLEAIRNDD